jgi:putative ABC transport system substrate-binding protein
MRLSPVGLVATLAVAILVAPLATHAQPAGKVYRIGFLRESQPPTAWVEAFQQGLRDRGYVEGQNVVVEFRVTDGSPEQLPQLAEELVRSRVDILMVPNMPAALAAKQATTTIPIVMVAISDPVGNGHAGAGQGAGVEGRGTSPAFGFATKEGRQPGCVGIKGIVSFPIASNL